MEIETLMLLAEILPYVQMTLLAFLAWSIAIFYF